MLRFPSGPLKILVVTILLAVVTGAMAIGLAVPSALAGDPVIVAAGDISCDPADASFNGGNGTAAECHQLATYNLITTIAPIAVLPLGDTQYYCGGYNAFLQSYALSWGKVKSISRPVVGNHEYLTNPGSNGVGTGCDPTNTNAAGYFNYFGAAAGDPSQGYYSYDVGAWHVVALNSNCGNAGGCGTGSPQETWLRADLAGHTNQCIMAYWHIPLWSSGGRAATNTQTFMQDLYNAGADVVLTGHDHDYERFAPQSPSGIVDNTRGIREFVIGTGGANHTTFGTIAPNSVVRNSTTFGVLKVTLHSTSYDWKFVPEAGKTFTDSGTASCHNTAPPTPTPPSSLAFSPVADTYVDSTNPSTNFGSTATLRVDGSPAQTSYLRFNVQGLTGSVIRAKLRVYNNTTTSTTFDVRGVADNTWGELTTTYSNAPAISSSITGNSGPLTAGTWTTIDVSPLVTGNGLVSLALNTSSGTGKSVGSRESANPPQLVVDSNTSTAPTNTPTATPLSPAPTNTPTRTPTLGTAPTATPTLGTAPTATPTATAASSTQVTFNSVADAYVYDAFPSTNYGTGTTLRVDNSPVQRSYLRFNVQNLTSPVTRATLRLYANSSLSAGFNVDRVADNTWGETTITYSNAPAVGSVINPSGAATSGAWMSIDVTAYVAGNGTFSFALDPVSSTALSLASRESGANAPQLVIQTGP